MSFVELLPPIQRVLGVLDQRYGVDAAWVFGSRAKGTARPDSDFDLAVLLRTRPDAVELHDIACAFEASEGVALDLVDLDRASPVLALQVAKHGQLVIENNRARRIDFIAHVPVRYEDLCIIRRTAERSLIERIYHG